MSGWQDRYWLIERGRGGPEVGEALAEDFVCCEVPVGDDFAGALEVFTSRKDAEAEARGIESLSRTKRLHWGWTRGEAYDTASGEVVDLSGPELFDLLDSSSVPYVLLDPPPVDRPVTERLHIESAPAFAKELRRRLIGAVSKGWA